MTLINSPSGGASGTIPFLRKASATEPYGNRVLNATQKRVFAVGRETVQAWGGSGAVQTLTLRRRERRQGHDDRAEG